MSTVLLIIVGAVALLVIWLIAAYNGLIRRRNQVEEAWSDIEVQLKRRYDLVPNLVETAKGYMTHEREVFENVTEARAGLVRGETQDKLRADNMLESTLKTLFAVAENYPDLKANVNFLELQRELTDTEDKIQAARRFYNGNVRDYNTAIESFPTNVLAGAFHFTGKPLFDIDETGPEGQPVKVKF
ncbi:MAG: LemA family protein [bacterium]|nr:LemA family protein [bacterium]MDZ4296676.1 LemA family protein [Patescibacteria group bacterium]